ncbi:MAG: polysaccharide deacetylase family protein, partial [Candidatus Azambacteria bacterium]|nr:polysaccharide deacetylase family protein [Candidatus Azambacteria bacterium]
MMRHRTLIIIFACIVVGGTALLFFGARTDSVSAPIVSTQKNKEVVVMPVPVVGGKTALEDAVPIIDYAKILARFKAKDVERVPVSEKLIALTFDGGGDAKSAEKIVRTLSEYHIASTFFLTGRFIEKFPEIVEVIRVSGGDVANHTMTHKDLSTLPQDEVSAEVSGMERVASERGIEVVPFFRFPYGAPTKETITLVNGKGYVAVRWTVDS